MNIHILRPYQIVSDKAMRYTAHYSIPAEQSLIVPIKTLGNEVSCDVRWIDGDNKLNLLENIVFVSDNLMPLDTLAHDDLYNVWKQHYGNRSCL